MSTDMERLEREAEAHRSSVNNTIEELRSRMSPGQIIDEMTDYFGKGQTNAAVEHLGRQVRDNPLALGLVGAGLAWLFLGKGVRDSLPDRDRRPYDDGDVRAYSAYPRDDIGKPYASVADVETDTSPGIGERASSAGSSAADRLSGAASSVASGVSAAASHLGAAASDAGESVRHAQSLAYAGARSAGQEAYRTGSRVRRGIMDTLQEEPFVFGPIALAVGAAIGASLLSTDVEDEYLGNAGDRLRDGVRAYGREAFESAEDVAAESYKAGSDEADRQGLKPSGDGDTLASKVSNVVGAATEAAKQRAAAD